MSQFHIQNKNVSDENDTFSLALINFTAIVGKLILNYLAFLLHYIFQILCKQLFSVI